MYEENRGILKYSKSKGQKSSFRALPLINIRTSNIYYIQNVITDLSLQSMIRRKLYVSCKTTTEK